MRAWQFYTLMAAILLAPYTQPGFAVWAAAACLVGAAILYARKP